MYMEWVIKLLRFNGIDERWFYQELNESYLDLCTGSTSVFIPGEKFIRILREMQLFELNIVISNDSQHSAAFDKLLRELADRYAEVKVDNKGNRTMQSAFTTSKFVNVVREDKLWCSIALPDTVAILNLLYRVGLTDYANEAVSRLGFDIRTGKHKSDKKVTKSKTKRRVIIREKNDE